MVRQSHPASPISSMRKGELRVSQALSRVRPSLAALRKRSSCIGRFLSLGFGFNLAHRLGHHLPDDPADSMVGLVDTLGVELGPHLTEHIFVPWLGQAGLDPLAALALGL